jgi:hypothetical protein
MLCIYRSFSLKKMPPKKKLQQPVSQLVLYAVLYDNKSSRHLIVPRDKLLYKKKDNLKVGTSATYNGDGDRSSRVCGDIVMLGKSCESN